MEKVRKRYSRISWSLIVSFLAIMVISSFVYAEQGNEFDYEEALKYFRECGLRSFVLFDKNKAEKAPCKVLILGSQSLLNKAPREIEPDWPTPIREGGWVCTLANAKAMRLSVENPEIWHTFITRYAEEMGKDELASVVVTAKCTIALTHEKVLLSEALPLTKKELLNLVKQYVRFNELSR